MNHEKHMVGFRKTLKTRLKLCQRCDKKLLKCEPPISTGTSLSDLLLSLQVKEVTYYKEEVGIYLSVAVIIS